MKNTFGTDLNQIPRTGELGGMAFQEPTGVVINPSASATPQDIGDMVFELTSDTVLKIKVKGSDGVVRSASLTLS